MKAELASSPLICSLRAFTRRLHARNVRQMRAAVAAHQPPVVVGIP